MRRLALAAVLAVAVASSAGARQIHVFGDSLVDAGNVSILTGGIVPWAGQGYFQGRFTNGATYVDLVQQQLTGSFSRPFLAGGTNYAFGGARGAGAGGLPVPSLSDQIGLWTLASGFRASSRDLYLLNMGGNDVFALQSGELGGLTPAAYTARYVDRMLSAVGTLYWLGARNIVVMGVPNPTPQGATLDLALNAGLDTLPGFIGRRVTRYSTQDFLSRIVADPFAYGLAGPLDTATPCWAVRPVSAGRVDCSGFLFFDDVHPTAEVHRALALDLGLRLGLGDTRMAAMDAGFSWGSATPEPGSWAMMIVGMGLVGAMTRRAAKARMVERSA